MLDSPAPDIWGRILDLVRESVSEQTYRTWFVPLTPKGLDGGAFTLEVPNPFFSDWLKEHHQELIEERAEEVLGYPVRVEFVLSRDYADAALPRPCAPLAVERSHGTPRTPASAPAPEFPLNERFTFDNFIVGKSNEFCFAACQAVASNPGRIYNPLFIYGGVGLGKTHVMQAIGNHLRSGPRPLSVRYVSTEKFMNEMIQSIRRGTMFDFRSTYRSADLLLIDDIQFLVGKESTQEEFFHTFNSLHDAHKQIVITSDRPPRELRELEERLVSRFNWGLVTDINPPEFETRVAILRKRAESERVHIPDDVIQLVAERIASNVRELEGSLVRLSALSSLTKCPINVELAERFLKDMITSQASANVHPEGILSAVAQRYDVPIELLKSRRRTNRIVYPRQVGMYLTKSLTGAPYAEIGALYGGRDHTTVLYACEKIERLRRDNPQLDRELGGLVEQLTSKSPRNERYD